MNILLVDDHESTYKEIITQLKSIGVEATIDFFQIQEGSSYPIVDRLPKGSELNKYHLALIDLELYGAKRSYDYQPEHLSGGTIVLPYLRKKSPWLPVIAYSRLFSEETEYFVSVAGSFGFDGHIQRKLFQSNSMNKKLWDLIIESASIIRKKSLFNQDYQKKDIEIRIDSEILKGLDEYFSGWKSVINDLFFFSDCVAIEKLFSGFSGALPFRIKAMSKYKDRPIEGNWFIKFSDNAYKLNEEVYNHKQFFISGVDFAKTIPLLWDNVAKSENTAAIVYQFASNMELAFTFFEKEEKLETSFSKISNLLLNIYSRNKIGYDNRTIKSLLIEEYSNNLHLRNSIEPIRNIRLTNIFKIVFENKSADNFANLHSLLEVSTGWIHGDLHLKNIMFGKEDLLIDLARSRIGPIVMDLARIATSIYCNGYGMLNESPPFLFNSTQITYNLKRLFDSTITRDGDKLAYNYFLLFELVLIYGYSDTSLATKNKIKTYLRSVDAF